MRFLTFVECMEFAKQIAERLDRQADDMYIRAMAQAIYATHNEIRR